MERTNSPRRWSHQSVIALAAIALLSIVIALAANSPLSADAAPSSQDAQAMSGFDARVTESQAYLPCYPQTMGNVWGDGEINSLDAQYILKYITGVYLPRLPTCSFMNVDCDADIDAVDALTIVRWIGGLPYHQMEPCPEMGTVIEDGWWERAKPPSIAPAAPGKCNLPLVMGDVLGRDTAEPNPEIDIDSLDALFMLRKIAHLWTPGGGVVCSPMDIDCDGDVDPVDALQILRWIAGLPVHQDEGCLEIGTPFGPYSRERGRWSE